MITPTIGRVVWFRPGLLDTDSGAMATTMRDDGVGGVQPLKADIIAVHNDRLVNLLIVDAAGTIHVRTEVQLNQDDGQDQPNGSQTGYAEWMPYQQGQAKKHAAPAPAFDETVLLSLEQIARVAHEVLRGYCEALGDTSQVAWEDAPQWQKDAALSGVELHTNNPDAGPAESHENWVDQKIADGWAYGPVKEPSLKQHPLLVSFHQLPVEQQAKDYIFRAVVHALVPAPTSSLVDPFK